jgi:hypothetical protein
MKLLSLKRSFLINGEGRRREKTKLPRGCPDNASDTNPFRLTPPLPSTSPQVLVTVAPVSALSPNKNLF